MKKFILAFLLIFVFITIYSQKPFYHKNKIISWVGETEFTYYLEDYDRLNFEPADNMQKETRTIKIDPYATCEVGNETYFTNFIINEVLENRRKVYSLDGDLMTVSQIQNAFGNSISDTITTFDPITYKETKIVTKTDPIYQVKAFKIRQWWYYDQEKESLGSMVQAIAPVLQKEQKDGSFSQKVLFWIEMKQDAKKEYSYNDPSVIWAKETLSTLSFKDIKKKKGRSKKALKNLTYKDPKEGKGRIVENDSWYPYCADQIDKDDVEKILAPTSDTIITYDVETYEEKIKIVNYKKINYKDFEYFRILQHWYFDKSTNTLASKVISIGPLKDILNEDGKLRFRKALYYIMSSQ
ncbi:MAG: hypothetical protein ACJAT4_002507 [Granulosicoccus sp.]|jgi:hypothetical protein